MANGQLSQRADFRSLVDQLEGVAIWIVTEPGEFDYISSGFEDIWGIPVEAAEEDVSRVIEGIHPEDRDRARSEIEQSGTDTSKESYEGRVVQPDGSTRWVQTRQFPLRDEDGNVTQVVGVCTDITEQKRRQQELEALNRVVRHDIRNDMQIILAWAEMLEDEVGDSGRERLEKILASGRHVVELTEITGEYLETLTGDEELPVCPVSLQSTLENELDRRGESYPEAEFVVVDEVPDVEVQANEMLASVFRNLLNNAVQHNDSENPVVEISCERGDEAVTVAVADNGPGIPDEQKETVFGKGDRGLGSQGTGIGLYLVDTLVDEFGGTVRVEDNDPTGAVFEVRLPTIE